MSNNSTEIFEYNPTDISNQKELKDVMTSNIIDCDVILRGESIESLGEVKKVNGFIGFSNSSIKNLGNLLRVKSDFWISATTVYSNLTSLGNLEYVGGDLRLNRSNIIDLGNLKKVRGKLNLRDTNIESLGSLEQVGGDLYLPKRLENKINLSKVEVKGSIRFWNDSRDKIIIVPKVELGLKNYEGEIPTGIPNYIYSFNELETWTSKQKHFYDKFKEFFFNNEFIDLKGIDGYAFILLYDLQKNYGSDIDTLILYYKDLGKFYPKTKRYTEYIIIEEYESRNDFNEAWEWIYLSDYIPIETVMEYEIELSRPLLDDKILVGWSGFACLTAFGKEHIEEIKSFVNKEIEQYILEKGQGSFFDIFLNEGEHFSPDYYKELFLKESDFNHYYSIDENQKGSHYEKVLNHVVSNAIFNQCRLIFRKAEDSYRESIGKPKVRRRK